MNRDKKAEFVREIFTELYEIVDRYVDGGIFATELYEALAALEEKHTGNEEL